MISKSKEKLTIHKNIAPTAFNAQEAIKIGKGIELIKNINSTQQDIGRNDTKKLYLGNNDPNNITNEIEYALLNISSKSRISNCNLRISLIKKTCVKEVEKDMNGVLNNNFILTNYDIKKNRLSNNYKSASKKIFIHPHNCPSGNSFINKTEASQHKKYIRSKSKKHERMQNIIEIQRLKKQMRRDIDIESDLLNTCYSTNPNRFLQRRFKLNPRFLWVRKNHPIQRQTQLYSERNEPIRKVKRNYRTAMKFYGPFKYPKREIVNRSTSNDIVESNYNRRSVMSKYVVKASSFYEELI